MICHRIHLDLFNHCVVFKQTCCREVNVNWRHTVVLNVYFLNLGCSQKVLKFMLFFKGNNILFKQYNAFSSYHNLLQKMPLSSSTVWAIKILNLSWLPFPFYLKIKRVQNIVCYPLNRIHISKWNILMIWPLAWFIVFAC